MTARCLIPSLLLACLVGAIDSTSAADKSGVTPQSISLPSGPGSVEGLGDSFQAQLNTGTFAYRVPLKLPPVRQGNAPDLAFEYDSGNGNGPLGLGWKLSLPSIRRQTERGLPRYGTEDTFVDWSNEELVALADGSFRAENEGGFVRFERATAGHWVARLRNGTVLTLGETAQARLDRAAGQTYAWFIESSQDSNGNRTEYSYLTDNRQIYHREIRYGLHATEPSSFYRVSFQYDTNRLDSVVDARPRFRCETRLRLASVTVWLGERRIRHWQINYAPQAPVSLIQSIRQFGDDRSRLDASAKLNEDFLPPLSFLYDPGWSATNAVSLKATDFPSVSIQANEADLVDVNHDGLPDLLLYESADGVFYSSVNPGAGKPWPALKRFTTTAFYPSLNAPTTRLVDLAGDGRSKVLIKDESGDGLAFYFRDIASATQVGGDVDFRFPANFPLDDPNVQFIDLNGDKAMDLMATDGNRFDFLINGQTGVGTKDRKNYLLPTPPAPPIPGIEFRNGWRLADLNGDRLLDLVEVGARDGRGSRYFLNLGWGEFGVETRMEGGPRFSELPAGENPESRLQLVDLDQDGLSDLVLVDSGVVKIWPNLAGKRWGEPLVFSGTNIPSVDFTQTAIRFADINGNGSVDIVWSNAPRPDGVPEPLQFLDLHPTTKPYQLVGIANGLGKHTRIVYRSSTEDMLAAAAANQPWITVAPFPVPVVGAVEESDGMGATYRTEYTYRDPYYDPAKKQFRGFARAEQREIGDDSQGAPTLVSHFIFDTGQQVEALKGRLLSTEAATESGSVFHRETNQWTSRVLSLALSTNETRKVTYAFRNRSYQQVVEGGPEKEAVTLLQESDFDDYGNQILSADYGRVEGANLLAWQDERIVRSTYSAAYPSGQQRWLLDRLISSEISDAAGNIAARQKLYYDDDTFTLNNLGQVSRGNLTAVQEWTDIPKNLWRIASRNLYDAFGNHRSTFDPLAELARPELGHRRDMEYDPDLHTFPTREIIYTGNTAAIAKGDPQPKIEMRAEYDLGLGIITNAVSFNGYPQRFDYDTFGRLISITKPGDTPALPTAKFRYVLAQPISGGRTINYVESRLREKAGETSTFDSRTYSDGMGRKRMSRTEAATPDKVIVKDAVGYNQRRAPWKSFLPYEESGSLDYAEIATNADFSETRHDALGRGIITFQPATAADNGRAFSTTTFRPLVKLLRDEEQTRPGSPHAGAAMRYTEDGFRDKEGKGRLRRVEEIVKLSDEGLPTATTNAWVTEYRYDVLGNFLGYTDSQGNQKEFRYDAISRKIFMDDPDRGTMTWIYDAASNLKETLDAKNQVIRYTYDGVNRLVTENYLDGKPAPPWRSRNRGHEALTNSVVYHYDFAYPNLDQGDNTTHTAHNLLGMLSWVEDLSGEEHTSYDARGRVEYTIKRLADPVHAQLVSYRTAFDYDSLDRVTALTYPDSDQVGYLYNARNLLTRITGGPSASIITNVSYRASDQLTRIDYGNGVRTTYEYDPRLRLSHLGTKHQEQGTELLNFTYEFDGVSNIKAIRDQRPGAAVPGGDKRRNTQLYQYDDLYRITRAQYSFALPGAADAANGFITYRYDRIGNMLNQSSDLVHNDRGVSVTDLGTMNYGGTAGRNNRLGRTTAEPGPHALTAVSDGNRAFPYDANGNMTVIDGLTNIWDFKDRLIRVEDTNMVARYTYDYTDRRVAKQVAWKTASTNNLTGAGTNSVLYPDKYFEVRESDAPVKYVWNGSTRVARVTGSLTTSQRTQRLRVYPGMNLVSLAVTATNALAQLAASGSLSAFGGEGQGEVVLSARRWNPGTLAWVNVAASDTLIAGTVLWVEMVTNATLTVTGTYAEPANQALPPGVNFVAGWGLQPLKLADALPGSTAAWTYDASARRWAKRLTGELQTLSDVPAMLAPGDALFARPEVVSTLTVPESALQVRYYHQDHLGSSSVLTDAAGALVSETASYAFGFARNEFLPRNLREPYGFTQKERDGESGLCNFEARYLSTMLGRFSRVDPLARGVPDAWLMGPQRLNVYSYCENTPLVCVDPSGTDSQNVVKDAAEPSSAPQSPQNDDISAIKNSSKAALSALKEAVNKLSDLWSGTLRKLGTDKAAVGQLKGALGAIGKVSDAYDRAKIGMACKDVVGGQIKKECVKEVTGYAASKFAKWAAFGICESAVVGSTGGIGAVPGLAACGAVASGAGLGAKSLATAGIEKFYPEDPKPAPFKPEVCTPPRSSAPLILP